MYARSLNNVISNKKTCSGHSNKNVFIVHNLKKIKWDPTSMVSQTEGIGRSSTRVFIGRTAMHTHYKKSQIKKTESKTEHHSNSRETYMRYNTMKTRRLKSRSPTITPATIPFTPRWGKSYHLLLNCKKLSKNSCKEVSAATANTIKNINTNFTQKFQTQQWHITQFNSKLNTIITTWYDKIRLRMNEGKKYDFYFKEWMKNNWVKYPVSRIAWVCTWASVTSVCSKDLRLSEIRGDPMLHLRRQDPPPRPRLVVSI